MRLVSLYRRVWEEIWIEMTIEEFVPNTGAGPSGLG